MAEICMTTIVQPAQRKSSTDSMRIELTVWDLRLLLIGPIQKGLVFLNPSPSSHGKEVANTLVDHLKASLSRTLDFFRPLAGRLAITENADSSASFFIDCNDVGAQFIYAVAPSITVANILEPEYVPRIVHSFFPLNGLLNHQGVSKPLLAVQVTELVDGFFIGCTINHAVADGSSFWHFFNSWSEISRGIHKISRPPVLQRWFPNDIDIDCPIRIPLGDNYKQLDDGFISFSPKLQEKVFHFTKQTIEGLKAKANAEMTTTRISSLQPLMAFLWRSIVRCKSSTVRADQETIYKIGLGLRPRLQPPLPENYKGLTTKAGELLEHGQGWAAWLMHGAIVSETSDEIRNFLKSWLKEPRIDAWGAKTTNALVTSSSPRFNMYGNDFGWGKPVAVRSGEANKCDGKITLFQGAEEGSVDVEVCLLSQTLHAMQDDAEFMEVVTVEK